MTFNFVTMGDEKYFESIQVSITQVINYYPESYFYIYDWGFAEKQRDLLESQERVVLIDWKDELQEFESVKAIDWSSWWTSRQKRSAYSRAENRRKAWSTLRKKIRNPNSLMNSSINEFYDIAFNLINNPLIRLLKKSDGRNSYITNRVKFEHLVNNTPICILDCLNRHQEPLVFIDGDAFIIDRIDEIRTLDYDVGVTMRRLAELDFSFNNCYVVNSGVIFFNGSPSKNIAFVKGWIQQIDSTFEFGAVQTALTRWFEESNPGIFIDYYGTGMVNIADENVRVKVFPCEKYNYSWIEEGIRKDETKILHFKGPRHSTENFRNLLNEIDVV